MFIQTQETPNPQTIKFIPGRIVMPLGTRVFSLGDDCKASKLAELLLSIEGIESVLFAENFLTATKSNDADWDILKPLLLATMIDYFITGAPVISLEKEASYSEIENEVIKQLREIIDTKVKPAVAQDGGSIVFRNFVDGVVYVELQGACSGCPSAHITLKNGIENMLKYYVPEVISVEAV